MMTTEAISIRIPMTFKKRGGRRIIVRPDGTNENPIPAATTDRSMVKAIARAFRWQRLLEDGTYKCLDDIARSERIGASFVSRIIRLSLLSPNIVDAILEGRQPAHLTLKRLMKPFPMEWEGQNRLIDW